jgi:hypothetical protein
MALNFDVGDPQQPKGHALVYFRNRDDARVYATYVLVLPIQMDMGKYLPPLLASQLGSMAGEALSGSMTSFAAPPMPEAVESVAELQRLASLRGDDLIDAGSFSASDMSAAMQETAMATQAYFGLYQVHFDAHQEAQPEAIRASEGRLEEPGLASVHRVLFELMNDRDRLAELSKLVGTMRFALERDDTSLAQETSDGMQVLEEIMSERYWVVKVRKAASDLSERGATLARLYLERCYKLIDEAYEAVTDLERQIEVAEG